MGLTLEALAFFWTQPHSEYPPFVHCNICLIVFPISNLSSCWNRCTAVLILIQDTKPGGWFNWSDKISTWKLLRLLLYLWGCMQSSLMREGTCWFHISPLQTILRSWWNVWSTFHTHQIFTFMKYKPTLSHLLLPAHLAADLLVLLKQPAEQTCKQELETHQHYQVWKRLLGKKISLPVVYICQDYSIFFTKLSQSLNEVEQRVMKGRDSGTHHSQGDHRRNCPHSWVLLKCSADSFTAVPQQNFLYH